MDFLDLLKQSGGESSLGSLASGLGLDSSKADDLVGALGPALLQGFKKQVTPEGGLSALQSALQSGNHERYLDDASAMSAADTVTDGNKILGHLFGSKDVSRNVAAQAAESTGIDASLIKKALPLLAGLAMGAMSKTSKTSNKGQSLEASLPGLLGGLAGGDGFGLDDVLGLAKKLF
jgi:hypothetical protein